GSGDGAPSYEEGGGPSAGLVPGYEHQQAQRRQLGLEEIAALLQPGDGPPIEIRHGLGLGPPLGPGGLAGYEWGHPLDQGAGRDGFALDAVEERRTLVA